MALSEPINVTLLGTARTLARVGTGMNEGSFSEGSRDSSVVVRHSYNGRRVRRQFRLDLARVAADPLAPSTNATSTMSMYIVADVPLLGFTVAEQVGVFGSLSGILTANTNAVATKWLGGES